VEVKAPEPGESFDPGLAANLFEVFFHSKWGGAETGSIPNLRFQIKAGSKNGNVEPINLIYQIPKPDENVETQDRDLADT